MPFPIPTSWQIGKAHRSKAASTPVNKASGIEQKSILVRRSNGRLVDKLFSWVMHLRTVSPLGQLMRRVDAVLVLLVHAHGGRVVLDRVRGEALVHFVGAGDLARELDVVVLYQMLASEVFVC